MARRRAFSAPSGARRPHSWTDRRHGSVSISSERPLDVPLLRDVSRALASTPSRQELGRVLGTWVRTALGSSPTELRILTFGRTGALRPLAVEGGEGANDDERREARLRAVRTGRPIRLKSGTKNLERAIMPMMSRGQAMGLVEVVAPGPQLTRAWEVLLAVVSQAAIALRHIRERAKLRAAAHRSAAVARMAQAVMSANGPAGVLRAAANLCHAQLRAPVVAWLAPEGSRQLERVGASGVDRKASGSLGRWSPTLPGSTTELESLKGRFGELLGIRGVEALRAGPGLLLVGAATPEARKLLKSMGSLLLLAIRQQLEMGRARARNKSLDTGLAWTAHELRNSLIPVRTALDLMGRARGSEDPEYLEEYRRAITREFDDLMDQLEDLLRWSVGAEVLRPQPTDVVRLVREAVAASPTNDHRVVINSPPSLTLLAEPSELRRAIANVVRNALAYSPSDAAVDVSVESMDGAVAIRVEDAGPGVAPEEAQEIFEPLVRGHAGGARRGGRGLGLFIARRIVEAHGGSIRIEPKPRGTAFRIELPREPWAISAS